MEKVYCRIYSKHGKSTYRLRVLKAQLIMNKILNDVLKIEDKGLSGKNYLCTLAHWHIAHFEPEQCTFCISVNCTF